MQSNPILGSIFMYGAIFAIFYFILIRPQSLQRKKHDELVRNLKKGESFDYIPLMSAGRRPSARTPGSPPQAATSDPLPHPP